MTPVVLDAFTRIMLKYFDARQYVGMPLGFQAFFGRPETGGLTIFSPDALVADIDIIGGNTKVAATVPRGVIGKSLGPDQKTALSEDYTSYSRKYPLFEEEKPYAASDLNLRIAGESPHAPKFKIERLRAKSQRDSLELVRRMVRGFEIMAAQSIRTGKHDAIIGTSSADLMYDFGRHADLTYVAPAVWTNAATAIIAQIETLCQRIKNIGMVNPDMMILGGTTAGGFVNNTEIKALADNKGFRLISIDSETALPPSIKRFTDAGFELFGRLVTPKGYKLWLFTYTASYTNAGGTPVQYMPDNEVWIGSSMARCDRLFGPDEMLPMTATKAAMMREYFGIDPMIQLDPVTPASIGDIILPEMFHADAYEYGNGKGVVLRMQAAPIFADTMVNGMGRITGTA